MFSVGDKVVYPMHGAGIIESIEEQEVLGEKRQYYIINLPLGKMRLMIPTKKALELGLRQVVDSAGVERVLEVLRDRTVTINVPWNRRYRTHLAKMKSGNIFEVAEVVRNLTLREQEKGLSSGEKKMLEAARQILLSEIVLAKGMDPNEAESLFAELIGAPV